MHVARGAHISLLEGPDFRVLRRNQFLSTTETALKKWLVRNEHPRHPSFLVLSDSKDKTDRPSEEVFLLNGKTWPKSTPC
jgi:hypothetical protein